MQDETLVEAVRRRNIVYDVSCINYRNNDKKERASREIAEELNREGKYSLLFRYCNTLLMRLQQYAKYGTLERCLQYCAFKCDLRK